MAIKTSGPLSITDIVAEFGGDPPHSLNEYYRGGGLVPESPVNANVPTSGAISIEDFYGSTNVLAVVYEIIGGGGGGGSGAEDRAPAAGTYAPSGTASSITITSTGVDIANSPGGRGGQNHGGDNGGGKPGEASYYGPGGPASGRNSSGNPAPATSYGAGGGGGGGDAPAWNDRSGASGLGGEASERQAGSVDIVPGTVLTVTVGSRGEGSSRASYVGAAGAGGYAKITVLGVSTEYTTPGTYTYTV